MRFIIFIVISITLNACSSKKSSYSIKTRSFEYENLAIANQAVKDFKSKDFLLFIASELSISESQIEFFISQDKERIYLTSNLSNVEKKEYMKLSNEIDQLSKSYLHKQDEQRLVE